MYVIKNFENNEPKIFEKNTVVDDLYEISGQNEEYDDVFIGYVVSKEEAKVAVKEMTKYAKKSPNLYGNMKFSYAAAKFDEKKTYYYHTSGFRLAVEFDSELD